jgi:putative hydrolase of the HAD superfamily
MKYILWDFDGTLGYREGIWSGAFWSGALYSVLLKNGIKDITIDVIKPYLTKSFTWQNSEKSHKELFGNKTWWEYYEDYFSNIFIELGIQKNISKKLSKEIKNEYMDLAKWHIYDDVIKTLELLIEKKYINIILSNHIPELEEIIKGLGIDKYFYKIYSSGNIGYEKPNSKIYEYVLNDMKINKNDCIMIGDSYSSDILGGTKMEIKSILVRSDNKNNYKNYCKNLENIAEEIEKI